MLHEPAKSAGKKHKKRGKKRGEIKGERKRFWYKAYGRQRVWGLIWGGARHVAKGKGFVGLMVGEKLEFDV